MAPPPPTDESRLLNRLISRPRPAGASRPSSRGPACFPQIAKQTHAFVLFASAARGIIRASARGYSGIFSFCPTLILSGSLSWSLLASKIFMYLLASP